MDEVYLDNFKSTNSNKKWIDTERLLKNSKYSMDMTVLLSMNPRAVAKKDLS